MEIDMNKVLPKDSKFYKENVKNKLDKIEQIYLPEARKDMRNFRMKAAMMEEYVKNLRSQVDELKCYLKEMEENGTDYVKVKNRF